MAVRIAASGDSLTRAANLPAGTSPYTACGWAQVYSDRGSVYQTLVSLEGASAYLVLLWEGGTANAGGVEVTGGTANNFASRPALNTPFFWAVVGNGTNVLGYWKNPGDATFVTASVASVAFTPTIILLGNSQASEWADAQFFNAMCFNRVLGVPELLAQSQSYKPVDPTGINFWLPLASSKDTRDYSANRRDPTVNGAPRTEQPTWMLRRLRRAPRLYAISGGAAAALAATPSSVASLTAALSTGIALAASLAAVASVTPALTTSIRLATTPTAVATVTASLTTGIALASTPAAVATVTPALTTAIRLAATPAAVATLTAGLAGGSAALAATPAALATLTAGLTTAIQAAAAPTAVATLTATLTGIAAQLATTPGAVASLTAGLTTGIQLAATPQSVATLTATFAGGAAQLAASPAAIASLVAGLTTAIKLAATPQSVATLTASLLGGAAQLAATPGAVASLTAALSTSIAMQSVPAAQATLAASLSTQIRLAATPAGQATLSASLAGAFLTGGPRYIVKQPRARLFTVTQNTARAFKVARRALRNFTVSTAMGFRFETKQPLELIPLTFDFSPDLAAGETLTGSPTVAFVTALGTDAAPGSLANGAAGFDATSTKAIVPVKGGVDLCEYDITVTVQTTTATKKLTLVGRLPVRATFT